MCVRGRFDLCRREFWFCLWAWKWFRGSRNDIDSAAAPEALFSFFSPIVRQIRGDEAEQCGCSWWWRLWCRVLMLSWTLLLGSSLPHPSQQSASGFPSVFPKLHWLRPLYLRGPGPLALAVTLRWQKNTESWQRCSQKHKAWGFCWQSLLFLGYCFVTLKNKNSFRCLSSYFSYCSTRDLDLLIFLLFILRNWNELGKEATFKGFLKSFHDWHIKCSHSCHLMPFIG